MATASRHRDASPRRATNISLPVDTVAKAKELGINLSKACETGLADEVRREETRRWKEEHREIIDEWNVWLENNDLPLAKHRLF